MKKIRRKLILSVITLMLVAITLGTSTYAWFSMNREVTATGMQVKATAASSLVITNESANINTTATNTIGLQAITTAIKPTTHLNGQKDENGSTITYAAGDSYLVHVVNETDVDAVSGYEQTGKTLKFAKSVNGDNGAAPQYYIDYTVYIAVKGDQLTGQDLVAKITPDVSKTLYNAISIDYWVNDQYVSGATDNFENAASGNSYTGVVLISNGTIPSAAAASNNFITIKMRCYFDGDLSSTTPGTAYVNNGTIDVNSVTFQVTFSVKDHQ